MRKDFGKRAIVTPLPVIMIATYDEEGRANVMNAAWGGQCGPKQIAVNLGRNHKTTKNIKLKNEFTVSFATKDTMVISDYFGLESGNNVDKISKSGVHVIKSDKVDAPIIEEYPLTLECKVIDTQEVLGQTRVVGEVINLSVDDSILDDAGNIDIDKMQPIIFDSVTFSYRVIGEKVGNGYKDGKQLK